MVVKWTAPVESNPRRSQDGVMMKLEGVFSVSSNENHDDTFLTFPGCVGFCFSLQEDGEFSMARRGAAITCTPHSPCAWSMCQEQSMEFSFTSDFRVQFHIHLSSSWN